METRRIGPYRVRRELGSGGMGQVLLAEVEDASPGLATGTQVAVKVVHRHLLAKPGFFKRFLREAEIGRRIDHPGVVRTLDADATEVDGQTVHYLVMEYVEGRTLRDLAHELGCVPESLLREVATQAVAALEAIHAAGIVHRDLKPENVILTPDHEVRIMDLGVARLLDASVALTSEGQFAGSVLYAAPEQFGGGPVGPAADQYALGVLLHELASGVHPFRRDSTAAVIAAHLETAPNPLLASDVDVTPFFSEVVRTLLAKKPADRFASTRELAAILREGERSDWWMRRESTVLRAQRLAPSLGVRRPTALYGRQAELDALRRALADAGAGRGRVVLVLGEPGIGKTRLLDAFLRQMVDQDAYVLYGSYPPAGGSGGISDAILGHFGAGELESALEPYLSSMRTLIPALASVVRCTATRGDAEALPAESLTAALVHLMRALAAEKPVVWVVDDLHFAEPSSRAAVLAMARAVEEHRVLLVLTAVPTLPEETVHQLTRLPSCRRLDLGRLSPREVVQLLRDAFQSEALADRLGARVAYKSDGVPFFVLEILRGLEEEGLLQRHPDGSYVETSKIDEIVMPSAVRDLVGARLHDVDRETRAMLDVAAVQGFEFDPDLVCRVLDLPRLPVLQSLAALARSSGVVRPAGARFCFDHHNIQEVLYEEMPESLRAEYHHLLAEAFEARAGSDVDDDGVLFLATHHLEGSRPEAARPYLDRAVRLLAATYRHDLLVRLANRALGVPKLLSPREHVHLLLAVVDHLDRLGRRDEVEPRLAEAASVAERVEDPTVRARVLVRQASWHRVLGRPARALALLEEALAIARAQGSRELEESVAHHLGNVLSSQGQYEAALPWYELRREIAEENGNVHSRSQALAGIAQVRYARGEGAEALRLFREALALAKEAADPWTQLQVAGNYALVLEAQGQSDEAREQAEFSCTLSRQLGDREGEAFAEMNLGNHAGSAGRVDDARGHYERARVLGREVGNLSSVANATGNLGNIAFSEGRWESALEHYAETLEAVRQLGDLHLEALAEVARGQVLTWLGDVDAGAEALARSLAAARASGVRVLEAYALFSQGSLAEVEGDLGTARARTGEALDILRATPRPEMLAETLVQQARLLALGGDAPGAQPLLAEAEPIAREVGVPRNIVQVAVHRARFAGLDPASAASVLASYADRIGTSDALAASYHLWRATNDEAHRGAAAKALDRLVRGAPEAYRETMLVRVPMHRAIRTGRVGPSD